jgi:Holliday junction resolvase RusA-like endonuclease
MADGYKMELKNTLAESIGDSIVRDWKSFKIYISYNSRYDVDNSVLCSKFVADALVELGFVKDDNPTYYTKLTIKHDKELPKDTYLVKITYYV